MKLTVEFKDIKNFNLSAQLFTFGIHYDQGNYF